MTETTLNETDFRLSSHTRAHTHAFLLLCHNIDTYMVRLRSLQREHASLPG